MSYRIEYGPAIPERYIKKKNPVRLQAMTAACLLLFALLVRQFYPAGVQQLRRILLPAAPTVTQQALDALMGDLRDGEPLGDAFTAFCTYIIDHDELFPH